MSSPLCHFEFMTDDPAKAKAFYGRVFGWEFDDNAMPGYTLIRTGQDPGGGMMMRPEGAPNPALHAYFMVDDIEATLKKAADAGGQVCVPKTPIPNVGFYGMFIDPEGIAIGLFTEK